MQFCVNVCVKYLLGNNVSVVFYLIDDDVIVCLYVVVVLVIGD